MLLALRALASALSQVFSHLSVLFISNAIAIFLSFPTAALLTVAAYPSHSWSIIPVGIVFFVCVLPNPAIAGIQYVAWLLARGDDVGLQDLTIGLRRFTGGAAKCWLLSTPVTLVMLVNVAFYAGQKAPFARILFLVWIFFLLTWTAAHVYVFPLLLMQEVKKVTVIYRNALAMTLARPGFTFAIMWVWIPVLAISSATGLITLIGLAVSAAIQQNAGRCLLPTFAESS
ncbi:MAG: hypothetical protein NVSMB52_13600 [Chloroflexota bacterium]